MTWTELTASDGHTLRAFRLDPPSAPRGAVVVAAEIFGINRHIQAVVARLAARGYVAIAPALFDRHERNFESGYDEEGFGQGRALAARTTPEGLVADVRAASQAVAGAGHVAVVGFCFGGSVAWLAAARVPGIVCAVSYYGSRIVALRDLQPCVPVQMHVGRDDRSFPLETVHEIVAPHERVALHTYDAGHGFNCDHRPDFAPEASALAWTRTQEFLAQHVG